MKSGIGRFHECVIGKKQCNVYLDSWNFSAEVGTRFSVHVVLWCILCQWIGIFCAFGVFSVPLHFSTGSDVRFGCCKSTHFVSLVVQISHIADICRIFQPCSTRIKSSKWIKIKLRKIVAQKIQKAVKSPWWWCKQFVVGRICGRGTPCCNFSVVFLCFCGPWVGEHWYKLCVLENKWTHVCRWLKW